MSRSTRHSKILEIINCKNIEKQEDLVEHLKIGGFVTTQATVSRDIRELGLIKVLSNDNVYKYAVQSTKDAKIANRLLNLFRDAVVSIVDANNQIVIKTLDGSANAVAMVVDQMNINEIVGTIAGDNVLLIITKNCLEANVVYGKLQEILE